jgi:omega-hydroxy-beta-dihydromenaquinone-9 sulfotransferase
VIQPDGASPKNRLRLLRSTWQSLTRKIDPSRSRLTSRNRIFYGMNSTIQSALHELQKKSYAEALAKTAPHAPIFVLGFWRSGTTFLHELLCRDPRFGFPTTYACLNPAYFLLTEARMRGRADREVSRAMDNLRYSWASPQEDEFALLALGAPSAYEALLVPSLMRYPDALLDLQTLPAADQQRWFDAFDYFLKLLTIQQSKPMVLKSPTHGYRVRTLQKKFPTSKHIVIERNPYEVFASNLKLWRMLIDQYGLERCTDEEIEDFLLAAYLLHERTIAEGAQHASPGSIANVRYEDLEKQPLKEACRVYATLQLGDFENVRPGFEEYIVKVSSHVRNRFRITRAQKARVDKIWGDLIARKGYDWPEAYIDLV